MDERGFPGPELILGGQKSGKSSLALARARDWLAGAGGRDAWIVATAEPGDDEMAGRIARHRDERARALPQLRTVEEGRALARAVRAHARPGAMVLVDCLTLWLTQLLMPMGPAPDARAVEREIADLLDLLQAPPGPIVLVSNEVGTGVVPMGAQARAFVDASGRLNQQVAARCERVTWVLAGIPVVVKGSA